jgi:hypothetical protein
VQKSWRNSFEDDKSRQASLLGHGRQSETRDEGTEETDEQPLQMTATAANARLLGYYEGPSDAWRTALALRADAQQSRPSAQSLQFCRVSTRPRRARVLLAGVGAPHEAVQSGARV